MPEDKSKCKSSKSQEKLLVTFFMLNGEKFSFHLFSGSHV